MRQAPRGCQQVFSAALIGRIESLPDLSLRTKIALANVIPRPDKPADYFSNELEHLKNLSARSQGRQVMQWLNDNHLHTEEDLASALFKMDGLEPVVSNLRQFMTE